MSDVEHRQYDELPVHDFTLEFVGVPQAEWPELNPDDQVTMIVNQAGTTVAVPLTATDLVARQGRWSPSGAAVATPGSFPFVIRVTQADNNSYTHPSIGYWMLKVDPAVVPEDVSAS